MATKISRIDQQATGDHYLEDVGDEQQHVCCASVEVEALPAGAQFYCPKSNRYLRMSGTEPPDQVWTEGAGWQFYAPLSSREGLIELDHSGDATEKADHIPGAGKKIRMAELYPDYYRDVRHLDEMDVYAVHDTFRVDDPSGCLQHASKKILLSGTRNGGKSLAQDIKEARDTLTRKLQLMGVE
jgi:hypothetical protein